jgi:ATP-dependent Clp protease ATP-binding subunit ClpC
MLQVLDDGILTDGLGRKIDFKNTIIIMTSNIGAKELREFGTGVGFASSAKVAQSYDHMKSTLEGAMRKVFRPEFLNRIDDVIIFRQLEKEHILRIVNLALDKVSKRLAQVGLIINVSDAVKEFIADKGFDQQFGARPLNRTIQKYIEDPIADELLNPRGEGMNTIQIDFDAEAQTTIIKIVEGATSAPAEA